MVITISSLDIDFLMRRLYLEAIKALFRTRRFDEYASRISVVSNLLRNYDKIVFWAIPCKSRFVHPKLHMFHSKKVVLHILEELV